MYLNQRVLFPPCDKSIEKMELKEGPGGTLLNLYTFSLSVMEELGGSNLQHSIKHKEVASIKMFKEPRGSP